jgi:hypothetical protein
MIRPADAYIFSDYVPSLTRKWLAHSYHYADMQLQQPWLWFMRITPTWPPDGFILKLVLTVFALVTCFLVIVHGYYRILKARIYGTTKKLESNDSATSTKKLKVIEDQLIAPNSTPTTAPTTTSPVPTIKTTLMTFVLFWNTTAGIRPGGPPTVVFQNNTKVEGLFFCMIPDGK